MSPMEPVLSMVKEVLDSAAMDKIPKKILQGCKGVAIISSMEIAFMISGGGGDGVVLKKNEDGSWSPPSALAINFVGAGVNFGMAEKYVLLFPMSEKGLEQLVDDQFKGGLEAGFAAGPVGREVETALTAGGEGLRTTFSYVIEKGAIIKAGVSAASIHQAKKANAEFYDSDEASQAIVFRPGAVKIPEGKGVEEIHEKLTALCA